jgi:hypothetical protein
VEAISNKQVCNGWVNHWCCCNRVHKKE